MFHDWSGRSGGKASSGQVGNDVDTRAISDRRAQVARQPQTDWLGWERPGTGAQSRLLPEQFMGSRLSGQVSAPKFETAASRSIRIDARRAGELRMETHTSPDGLESAVRPRSVVWTVTGTLMDSRLSGQVSAPKFQTAASRIIRIGGGGRAKNGNPDGSRWSGIRRKSPKFC
jgi:hypothetical protein